MARIEGIWARNDVELEKKEKKKTAIQNGYKKYTKQNSHQQSITPKRT